MILKILEIAYVLVTVGAPCAMVCYLLACMAKIHARSKLHDERMRQLEEDRKMVKFFADELQKNWRRFNLHDAIGDVQGREVAKEMLKASENRYNSELAAFKAKYIDPLMKSP